MSAAVGMGGVDQYRPKDGATHGVKWEMGRKRLAHNKCQFWGVEGPLDKLHGAGGLVAICLQLVLGRKDHGTRKEWST